MITEEKVQLVKDLIAEIKNTNDYHDKLYKVLGSDPNSPLLELHFRMIDYSIDLVIKLIGDNEEDSWLNWYIWDNAMGANGFEAGYDNVAVIDTPEKLINLIESNQSIKK